MKKGGIVLENPLETLHLAFIVLYRMYPSPRPWLPRQAKLGR